MRKIPFGRLLLVTLVVIRFVHMRENPYAVDGFSEVLGRAYGNSFLAKSFQRLREKSIQIARDYFPSPHSELLLGMTLGIDELDKVPRFKRLLKDTGTIHIVVVSGFNIALVFDLVYRAIGSRFKWQNILVAELATLLYALLAGFEAPVVRAWVMGSISGIGKYSGRKLAAMDLLIVTALIMLAINPIYIQSLSFQLSFMATLGVIAGSVILDDVKRKTTLLSYPMFQDMATSMSAQVVVWPLISYTFGRVSVVSPLINALILWTVPISTVLGGIMLFLTILSPLLGGVFVLLVFASLDIFIGVIYIISSNIVTSNNYWISLRGLYIYYTVLASIFVLLTRKASARL